jgi:hypothetical protein
MSLPRKRAELLAHSRHTNSQDTLPERGKKLAYTATRDGVAARFPEPAVQKSMAVDLTLLGSYDPLLSDRELHIVKAAKPHDANTLSLLQTVPGLGTSLSLVLRDERHDIRRSPSVQDFLSDSRLVQCARESAGQRDGTAGAKRGKAALTGAFSAAAGLLRRDKPAGQQSGTKLEKQPGQGTALTLLAQKLGRAVYSRRKRQPAFDRHQVLHAA